MYPRLVVIECPLLICSFIFLEKPPKARRFQTKSKCYSPESDDEEMVPSKWMKKDESYQSKYFELVCKRSLIFEKGLPLTDGLEEVTSLFETSIQQAMALI